MFITKRQRLNQGLAMLLDLIASGKEYPDALYKASSFAGVSSMELQAAYDLSN